MKSIRWDGVGIAVTVRVRRKQRWQAATRRCRWWSGGRGFAGMGTRTRGVENLTGRAMCACVGQRGCTTTGFSLSKIVLKIKYLKIVPR
jgi:hypothetical protein